MAAEHDADQIECLALAPIDAGPDVYQGIQKRKLVVRRENPQPNPPVVLQGQQVAHCGVARSLVPAVAVGRIIDAAQVNKLIEAKIGVIAQYLGSLDVVCGRHLDRYLTACAFLDSDPLAQGILEIQAKAIQLGAHVMFEGSGSQRAMVLVRLILFCSCMMP